MRFYMAWATSASRLANRPLSYVFLDEEDKYPPTAGKKEASPSDLAKKRTRTFRHMRKIWRSSSPSVETGPIWTAMQDFHMIFDYWALCPICGREQKMVFEQIKWTEGERDPKAIEASRDVWYECEHCGEKCDDRLPGMVPGGNQVACRLAGVDTHGLYDAGRLDYEIRAFGYGHSPTTWCIRYGHLNSFEALASVLWEKQYKDADGNLYPVFLTCIDAMGRRPHDVYEFCRRYRGRILPCQGKGKHSRVYSVSTQDTYPGTNKKNTRRHQSLYAPHQLFKKQIGVHA